MAEVLSEGWVAALIEASADRSGAGSGDGGQVAIAIGKTKRAEFRIVDGRVTEPDGATDGESGEPVGVTIPMTAKQLAAIVGGTESLAQAFMRGDVKPEGATGPLLAAIELFEDASFRHRFAGLV
ncbi:MAG: hypothetical protein GY724_00850 [Actinomycetia bacterium]|nr:hypothetical protein [Actinomycetes bacterium]